MSANVDQSGNAHLKVTNVALQTLLKFWPDQRVTVEKYDGFKWSSSGDLLGNYDFQCGIISVPIKADNTNTTTKLTFPHAFSTPPAVVCSPITSTPSTAHATPQSVTSTGCNIVGIRTSGTETLDVFWIAVAR